MRPHPPSCAPPDSCRTVQEFRDAAVSWWLADALRRNLRRGHRVDEAAILGLERQGWALAGSRHAKGFYDRLLTADAVLFLPGEWLDRTRALEYWLTMPRWAEYRLLRPKVMPLADVVAAVSYRVVAREQGRAEPYRADCVSVYAQENARWRLTFHEQTPVGSSPD
ncbi:hypothetical protein DI005_33345 [Prauserella sp. PE36]|nr:hypothetical protein DI005_33345 [Prauserella sp. PE36]